LWLVNLERGTLETLRTSGDHQWAEFTPDGEGLFFAGFLGDIHWHSMMTGNDLTLIGHDDITGHHVPVQAAGQWTIATAGVDRHARIWKRTHNGPAFRRKISGDSVFHLRVLAPGVFAFDGRNGLVGRWTLGEAGSRELTRHAELAHGLAQAGALLASASFDGTVSTGTAMGVLDRLSAGSPLSDVALSGDGSILAAGATDGAVWLWRLPGALAVRLPLHTNAVSELQHLGDSPWLVSAGRDGKAFLLDTSTIGATELCSSPLSFEHIAALEVAPGSFVVACGGLAGEIRVVEVPSLREIARFDLGSSVRSLGAGDGHLVAGSKDGRVVAYDLAGGTWRDLVGHRKAVVSIAFLDGNLVATSDEATVRINSLHDGSTLVLAGSKLNSYTLAYDPATHVLVSASWDGRLIGWKIDRELLAQMPPASPALLEWLDEATTVTIDPEGMRSSASLPPASACSWPPRRACRAAAAPAPAPAAPHPGPSRPRPATR
jgi:WD40 repeat protein